MSKIVQNNASATDAISDGLETDDALPAFDLWGFFPYQARVFYRHVTDSVSDVYRSGYGMKPYEWRTLAILGQEQPLTPLEIVSRSSMDKVSVSRAVAGLRERGWLIERGSRKDGRSKLLRLSKAGVAAYSDLVPRMKEVERRLLSVLTPAETEELVRLMRKVRRAETKSPE